MSESTATDASEPWVTRAVREARASLSSLPLALGSLFGWLLIPLVSGHGLIASVPRGVFSGLCVWVTGTIIRRRRAEQRSAVERMHHRV